MSLTVLAIIGAITLFILYKVYKRREARKRRVKEDEVARVSQLQRVSIGFQHSDKDNAEADATNQETNFNRDKLFGVHQKVDTSTARGTDGPCSTSLNQKVLALIKLKDLDCTQIDGKFVGSTKT